jgi:DNA polymerase I
MSGKISIFKESSLRSGKSFDLLEKVLYEVVGIERGNVTMFDLPLDRVKFAETQTDVVICIGESAMQYCTQLKGITKHAGTVVEAKGYKIVPIVSPGYIEHNPNYLRKFAEDIHTAYQISLGIDKVEISNQWVLVQDFKVLERLLAYVEHTGYCCFDFETTELTDLGTFDPNFEARTLSITFQQGSSYVIPLYHPESPFLNCIGDVVRILQPIFSNPKITKVGHNVKFDAHVAAWLGLDGFRGPFHDTMLMHQLIYEGISHKLKDIVREYYPRFGNYEAALSNWNAPLKELARYNALDSDLTFRLYWVFTNILMQDPALYIEYRNLTAPGTKTLFFAEEFGMHCDKAFLIEAITKVDGMVQELIGQMNSYEQVIQYRGFKAEELRLAYIAEAQKKLDKERAAEYKSKSAQANQLSKILQYEDNITSLSNGVIPVDPPEINYASPDQLKGLLFSKEGFGFKVPEQDYQRLAKDSTGADNLSLIKDKSGFLEKLQIYRQLQKINSTYLKSILEKLDSDHNIHTTLNQDVAKTGRLSSKNPNLQNIISRTKFKVVEEAVGYVKKAFIPPDGYTLIQADYSQIELRVIAHYAGEKTMLQIYRDGKDIHEMTAANSRGYTLEEFQKLKDADPKGYKQMRYEAKAENFGFVYGMSAQGFKEYCRTDYNMIISGTEAEKRREAYFKKYPMLLDYHKTYIGKARKFGYVRTFFGRKIHLPDINSVNSGVRGHAERNAINSPIQGTAGEMTIFALSILFNRLPKDVIIVNSIHDSILIYIPDNKVDEVIPVIKEAMEKLPLREYFEKEIDSVPIVADFEKSKLSWKDLKG